MPTATSGYHEKLVHADFAELVSVPPYDGGEELIALKGASPAQVTFATQTRTKKLLEWQPDLPKNIYDALLGIADATWWLANQAKDSSNIGWPQSWVGRPRNQTQPELGQPSSLRNKDRELAEGYGAGPATLAKFTIPTGDLEQFDSFARKVCQLPDMAYLTMLALLYRQTKDGRVLAKFVESRRKIDGYLDAIDNILGSPGE